MILCAVCLFKNSHDKDHHIIDINDKESLEKNGVSYDKSIIEFKQIFNKVKNIKQKIEEEIEKIIKLHEKIMNDITASFIEQHEKLNQKENELKSELDLKVTNIKEELENFLIESNDVLTSCERTEKEIKYYEKKNDNKDIKTLYYITKINKNNETAKGFFKKKIKNLDINFNSKLNIIDYKDRYIQEIPIPKNIKIEKQKSKVIISWNIDNYDNENIKYKIEIKSNDQSTTYEASKTNLTFEKFLYNINYEVKIRAVIDDFLGDWSEVQKFKIDHNIFGDIIDKDDKNNMEAFFGSSMKGNPFSENKKINLFSGGFNEEKPKKENDKQINPAFGFSNQFNLFKGNNLHENDVFNSFFS